MISEAIEDAKENAALNNIDSCTNFIQVMLLIFAPMIFLQQW